MNLSLKKTLYQISSLKSISLLRSIHTTSYTYNPNKNSNTDSSGLLHKLITKIKSTGPITIHEYMREALVGSYGYYTQRAHIGDRGDFITSPEISQVFGELVAVFLLSEWIRQGKPPASSIIELGPGNGTLVSDILRVMKEFKLGVNQFESINLVETSSLLATAQYNKLCIANSKACNPDQLSVMTGISELGVPIQWFASIDDVPKTTSFIVANEFFDSLPVHQFIRTENIFQEVFVDIDEDNHKLRFVISNSNTLANKLFQRIFTKAKHSYSKLEISLSSLVVIERITELLNNSNNGACLIIDYGTNVPKDEFTLRAFQNHKQVDPLNTPGFADLTVDVNFNYLSELASHSLNVFGPVTQNQFLHQMGIRERISALMKKSSTKEDTNSLIKGYEYLTSSNFMGSRFNVMSIIPKQFTNTPYGFIKYSQS